MTIFKHAPVSVQNAAYAMATSDGSTAEITMYGDIYDQRPIDPWTGEEIPGDFILLDDFLNDLEQVRSCKEILIRINSYGGDCGVSLTIHNKLRELARDGAKLTCVVDGYAMSGGSIIMCACDNVQVNPSSLIMIHKCWLSLWGGYNSDELRNYAKQMDAWDKAAVEVYKRKTGLSDTVLIHMMADTTHMVGREAVEKGFADELLDNAEPLNIAASADGRALFVRGKKYALAPGMIAPDDIPTVTPETAGSDETNIDTPDEPGSEGGNSMTLDELRAQYPELVEQIEAGVNASGSDSESIAQATQTERNRLAEIDEVAGLFDPQLVHEAKYGETACSAAELAYRAAREAAKKGSTFLAGLMEDAEASGNNDVPAVPGEVEEKDESDPTTPEAQMAAARAGISNLFKTEEA